MLYVVRSERIFYHIAASLPLRLGPQGVAYPKHRTSTLRNYRQTDAVTDARASHIDADHDTTDTYDMPASS